MSKFFKKIKEGLEDALAHKKGKITLRTETIEIPEPPAEYTAKEIRKIREKGRYSQNIFAKVLNVSPKTVQAWESGERFPSHAALRLLEIVDKGIYRPEIVKRVQNRA
jgi:putative transcriptional regulator